MYGHFAYAPYMVLQSSHKISLIQISENFARVWKRILSEYESSPGGTEFSTLKISSFVDPAKYDEKYPKLKGRGCEVKSLAAPPEDDSQLKSGAELARPRRWADDLDSDGLVGRGVDDHCRCPACEGFRADGSGGAGGFRPGPDARREHIVFMLEMPLYC